MVLFVGARRTGKNLLGFIKSSSIKKNRGKQGKKLKKKKYKKGENQRGKKNKKKKKCGRKY